MDIQQLTQVCHSIGNTLFAAIPVDNLGNFLVALVQPKVGSTKKMESPNLTAE